MSGGPAIVNGRLIGVVRSTTEDSTTVVPIGLALDYFHLMGIVFSDEGLSKSAAGEALVPPRAYPLVVPLNLLHRCVDRRDRPVHATRICFDEVPVRYCIDI
jgi:hypothetical protein